MDILVLNCCIRSPPPLRVFEVHISKKNTVPALREAIKNKKPGAFHDVDPDALDLYKPSLPLPRLHQDTHKSFILSEHAQSLQTGPYKLSDLFPEQPPEEHIHVIVDAPPTIACCFRGATLRALTNISIRPDEYIDQLIPRINVALHLENVLPDEIRFYRTSGDEIELQESINKTGDGILLHGLTTLLPQFLDVPILDRLCIVVELSTRAKSVKPPPLHHPGVAGTDPIAAARDSFIQARPRKKSPSDGSHPSAFRQTQQMKDTQIPCGRPRDPEEIIPVTLLHPVFGQFLDDCQTGTMTADDNHFTGKLANAMSDLYLDEAHRVEAVSAVFKDVHLNFNISEKVLGTKYEMDASLSVDDQNLPPYCIAEFKNEAAASKSEPYMQAVGYYLETTKTYALTWTKSPLPCFLLAIFGPYMVIAGAAWNLRPVVQVLSTPLAFHYHSSDTQNQLTVTRHMAALRKALRTLKMCYENLSDGLIDGQQSHDVLFPYPAVFKSLEDETLQTVRYTTQLSEGGSKKGLIFFGLLKEDPTAQICIKFARSYSKEVHLFCVELGFAPKLRGFKVLPGGWYMIVMNRLIGYELLADLPSNERLPRTAFGAMRTQLKALHASQMVHGDLRDTNLFVKKDDRTRFMLIDFDWAGVEGVVRYPPYVNYIDIWRPKGARDGLPIKAAHDLEMLSVITEVWATKNL